MRIHSIKGHHFGSDLKPSIDWDVYPTIPFTKVDGVETLETDYLLLKRNDTNETIHLANKTYCVTPNSMFMDYANQLEKASGFINKGYSEFRNGNIVMAVLECDTDFIKKQTGVESDQFMIMITSHDGTMPVCIASSNILPRCTNAFSHLIPKAIFRHTKNHHAKLDDFVKLTERFRLDMEAKAINFGKLKEIKIDSKILDSLANRLLSIDMDGGKVSPQQVTQKELFMNSARKETNDLGMNLWGFFNGVTHYTTHVRQSKTDNVLNLFGGNMKMNLEGLDLAYAYGKEQGLVLAK